MYRGQFPVGAAITPGMVLVGKTREFLERQHDVIVTDDEAVMLGDAGVPVAAGVRALTRARLTASSRTP